MQIYKTAAIVAGLTVAAPSVLAAATFTADLSPFPNFNVSGQAVLDYDEEAGLLEVTVNASGLTPFEEHEQHIHGTFGPDGGVTDATTPTLDQDTDGDGFIELAEGQVTYGPILLELEDEQGIYPIADAEGNITFNRIFDLQDPDTFAAPEFSLADLTPLSFREIVLHGANVPAGVGMGTDGEVDGTAGYKPFLPVSAGAIAPIPLPAAAWTLIAGLGALFGVSRRRRKSA